MAEAQRLELCVLLIDDAGRPGSSALFTDHL